MSFFKKIFNSVASVPLYRSSRAQSFSDELQRSSESLAAAASQQSAAVQETVASIAEMRAMFKQTDEHVQKCQDLASATLIIGNDSKQSVKTLADAMQSISNTRDRLESIRQIFMNIESKTKAINDIVLKTQILSFNASIEAARAGQFGKGFSVVADEVGRLAQMSGKAAKEIDSLLKGSHEVVSSVITHVLDRVSDANQMCDGVYKKCDSLTSGVDRISESITQVGRASHEQLVGIEQIAKAIEQIDVATNENRLSAEKLAEVAFAAKSYSFSPEEAAAVTVDTDAAPQSAPEPEKKKSKSKVKLKGKSRSPYTSSTPVDPQAEIACLIDTISKKPIEPQVEKLKISSVNADDDSFKPVAK